MLLHVLVLVLVLVLCALPQPSLPFLLPYYLLGAFQWVDYPACLQEQDLPSLHGVRSHPQLSICVRHPSAVPPRPAERNAGVEAAVLWLPPKYRGIERVEPSER